jgi:hypothetical protein
MILFFATFSVCSFDVAQLRGTASAASAGVQDDSKAKEEVQKVERDWSAAMTSPGLVVTPPTQRWSC